jgi:hypothetical protein
LVNCIAFGDSQLDGFSITRRRKGDVCIVCGKTAYSEITADCESRVSNKLFFSTRPHNSTPPQLQNILYNQQLVMSCDRQNRTFREPVELLTYKGLDMRLFLSSQATLDSRLPSNVAPVSTLVCDLSPRQTPCPADAAMRSLVREGHEPDLWGYSVGAGTPTCLTTHFCCRAKMFD